MSCLIYRKVTIFSCLCLLASGGAAAEPKVPDAGSAIKKAQGMIRQLSQDKTALEAEKAAWQAEKNQWEAKQKGLEETVRKLSPLPAEIERYKAGLENLKNGLEGQLEQERQRREALVQKYNEMVAKANAIYADNQLLVQAVQEREQWIGQCAERNQQLRELNKQVINQFQQKSLLQQVVELEPLTGIAAVETESIAEDFRYKLQQLKITPFKAADKQSAAELKSTEPAGEVKP